MTNFDLSRLPTGAMGWDALLEWVLASDDRQERYFLELKSDVDLNSRHGRHKVAKFILGAANRDPGRAASRFSGHALMILGVSYGQAAGVPNFEAKDLAREVQKFTGAEGPGWDFERIPGGADNDVIAIIVSPPTGRIWPCLSDGEKLFNGDVYLRADGETRKATGGELHAMLARTTVATIPEIDVEVIGCIAIRVDVDYLSNWVNAKANEYLSQLDAAEPYSPLETINSIGFMERRTEHGFQSEVERWHNDATEDPYSGVTKLASRYGAGVQVRVTNHTKTFLRDVQVDIELDENVRALEWLDPNEEDESHLFPDRPLDWGSNKFEVAITNPDWSHTLRSANPNQSGIVFIKQETPARLSMEMDSLRPEMVFETDDDEVVLAIFVEEVPSEPITARWRLTAGDIHDVLHGETVIPTSFVDLAALTCGPLD